MKSESKGGVGVSKSLQRRIFHVSINVVQLLLLAS